MKTSNQIRMLFVALCPLLGLLPGCATFESREPASQARLTEIRRLLGRSTHEGDPVPSSWPRTYRYDPAVHSAIASLYSRLPARKDSEWKDVPLKLPENARDTDRFFTRNVVAHYRPGSSPDSPFFIVIPGGYATWGRGSYVNQAIGLLDGAYNRPHILCFPGVLSPEFLKGNLDRMPWDSAAMGRDLFLRVQAFAAEKAPGARGGVIGYSSGATIAIEMLAANSEASEPFLSLGALSFSPILHQRLTFSILDGRGAKSTIPRSKGLTTIDRGNVWTMMKNFGAPGWRDLLALSPAQVADFHDRFFNESSTVDLRATLLSVGLKSAPFGEPPNHYAAYVRHGFKKDVEKTGLQVRDEESLQEVFDQRTDVRVSFAKIRDPLLVYFSADDPILSNADGTEQPAEISRALSAASNNRNILVYNPRKGGHVGAVVDEVLPQLVGTFFK